MRPRRRPAPAVAALLPASRLPVGTPAHRPGSAASPATSVPRPDSKASNHSAARSNSQHHEVPFGTPATTSHGEDSHDMSLADMKLDRQRKRNEAAEASLNPSVPLLEKRQTSRSKGKWKPFDYATDPNRVVPVETRMNTYSRASSHSRPMSALSHRTDDSAVSDASGFQLFTGRKSRRHPIELRAYGSEKQQTTVEASFDKRAIYEVFGKELPTPEYLEQNAGYQNGQVQFLQHPNGDVSAQQWSASRYEWVNLGQFSNIRKRVEGQLASDRLKGEMAHHTLQQNTLQYFRTIAKQREAIVMGLPFGPKEVEAALPTPNVTLPIEQEKDHKPDTRVSPNVPCKPAEMITHDVPATESKKAPAPAPRSPLPPNVPREPAAQRWEGANVAGGASAYDPFYLASTNQSSAYPNSAYSNRVNYPPSAPNQYASINVAQTPSKMSQSYQFPPVAIPNQIMQQSPGAQKYFAERAAIADRMQSQWRQVYGNQSSMGAYAPPPFPHRTVLPDEKSTSHEIKSHQVANDREIIAPQPKSISSIDRSVMRHTLYKLGETAKERNLSQANIRTVLHDPFQSPSTAEPTEEKAYITTSKIVESPVYGRRAASHKLTTQSSPLPALREYRKDVLQESSPDTQWTKRPYEHSTPLLAKWSASRAFSQAVVGTAPDAHDPPSGQAPADMKKRYEHHLNEWWNNGSTFARQEDLFQTIVAAHAADGKIDSPPAHLTPIGPPSRNTGTAELPFNEATTRLLIPVWENLASYVDGPLEKPRDYWCPWGPAPEWCIDRSPDGNKSFFEAGWGSSPQRIGRDPRYSGSFGGSASESASRWSRWHGVDQRFAYAGRF